MKDTIKLSLFLTIVSIVAASILAFANHVTAPIILQRMIEAKQAALGEIIVKADEFKATDESLAFHEQKIYIAKKDGSQVGQAIYVESNGYGGPLQILVGLDSSASVSGIKILKMAETPGLGTKVADKKLMPGKPFTFLAQFVGKNLSAKLKVKEDIVGITGATITSAAVANGVLKAFKAHTEFNQN